MGFMLSFLPRSWLQMALYLQYRRTLPRDQRIRLDYWGTPGSGTGHHPFSWADTLPAKNSCQEALDSD